MTEPEPIKFDWRKGTASITWEAPNVGLIRFHVPGDESEYPKQRGSCLVKVTGGMYEFKGLACFPAPTKDEHRAIKGYLKSLGLKGFSRRLRRGDVVAKLY